MRNKFTAHLHKHLWIYTLLAITAFFVIFYFATVGWPDWATIKMDLLENISHATTRNVAR